MIITIKTAVTFRLPKEKTLMEQFEQNNSDWVLDDDLASRWHYTPTTNTACGVRIASIGTQMQTQAWLASLPTWVSQRTDTVIGANAKAVMMNDSKRR